MILASVVTLLNPHLQGKLIDDVFKSEDGTMGKALLFLTAMFILGALVGHLVAAVFVLALGAEAGPEYGMLVSYPLMFIVPMLWASGKSRRSCMTGYGMKLDNDNFAPLGGWMAALMVF